MGSLCLPLAPAEAAALVSLRVVSARGPTMGFSLAGPSCGDLCVRTRSLMLPVSGTARLSSEVWWARHSCCFVLEHQVNPPSLFTCWRMCIMLLSDTHTSSGVKYQGIACMMTYAMCRTCQVSGTVLRSLSCRARWQPLPE